MENLYARFTALNMSARQNNVSMQKIMEQERLSVNQPITSIIITAIIITGLIMAF